MPKKESRFVIWRNRPNTNTQYTQTLDGIGGGGGGTQEKENHNLWPDGWPRRVVGQLVKRDSRHTSILPSRIHKGASRQDRM